MVSSVTSAASASLACESPFASRASLTKRPIAFLSNLAMRRKVTEVSAMWQGVNAAELVSSTRVMTR